MNYSLMLAAEARFANYSLMLAAEARFGDIFRPLGRTLCRLTDDKAIW